MNIEKLLSPDSPPTRRKWDALDVGVKNWSLYALVMRDAAVVQLIQEQPNTALELAFDAGDEPGENTYTGTGFSKVRWPDVYDAAVGLQIARVRAIRKIVKALIFDDIAYQVITAKWDHYQDTAEKHHLNAIAAAEAKAALEAEEAAQDAEIGIDPADFADDGGPFSALDDAEAGVDPGAEGGDGVATLLVRTMV